MDTVIVHYDEIGLKGKNRGSFERLLMDNISKKTGVTSMKRESGQITLTTNVNDTLRDALSKIPGIAYFSFAQKVSLDFDKLKEEVVAFLEDKEFTTFKIDAKRHDKEYPFKSTEINEMLGEVVIDVLDKKVLMKHADLVLKVEITHTAAYISYESVRGVGGLPTDPRQKVVALLSGGFDSPVAAFSLMKRGCQVILVHFQNESQMATSVKDKIKELAAQLSKFQVKTILYIVPFEKLQQVEQNSDRCEITSSGCVLKK